MWPERYWPNRYWDVQYWPKAGIAATVVPPTPTPAATVASDGVMTRVITRPTRRPKTVRGRAIIELPDLDVYGSVTYTPPPLPVVVVPEPYVPIVRVAKADIVLPMLKVEGRGEVIGSGLEEVLVWLTLE